MNSAVLGLISIVWLVLAYRWYGRRIARRLVQPDDSRPTPAVAQRDDIDFKPARPMVLFGHHFSSIAGAGPIIGPVVAVAFFGWGISFLWILLAVVLMGAVHDYLALMVSVRHEGRSIPQVARSVVGERSRLLFQVFVWLTLVLVIAAFVDVATQSFMKKPEIVLATFGLIPWAMLFGWAVNRRGFNLTAGTILAVGGLIGLIYVGYLFPVLLHEPTAAEMAKLSRSSVLVLSLGLETGTAQNLWYLLLIGYGLLASVMPVWLLLQPRDYIANWILIVGMLLGFAGLFVSHPDLSAEFFTTAVTAKGPVWPMLFVIIACGAISGFHSLVASGTTSKQLAKESDGLVVGFGGMLTEGLLAVLALLAVGAGLGPGVLNHIMFDDGGGGPVVAFGTGFGNFVDPLVGALAGTFFGITMLKAFVMTTLDTSVRLTRFITSEMGGERFPILNNRLIASVIAVVPAYLLVASGSRDLLWPMFASANQLVAGLTLIVVSAYLVGVRKPVWYTLGPAILMLVTTVGALVYQIYRFLIGFPAQEGPNWLLGTIAVLLLLLSFVVAGDTVAVMRGRRRA